MKQNYKLWYNPTPKRNSPVHKGYSITVDINWETIFYLNFMSLDNWYATTQSPQLVTDEMNCIIPAINKNRADDKQMLLADFTPKEPHFLVPRWTCMLNVESHTPELIFVNWADINQRVCWIMSKKTHSKKTSANTHFYADDYNKLEIQRGVKQAVNLNGFRGAA
ncbi:hypothetical protein [Magnetovibrio blakemorei]|nr:hypothetical protein [Magnetovibrio blakemorei]